MWHHKSSIMLSAQLTRTLSTTNLADAASPKVLANSMSTTEGAVLLLFVVDAHIQMILLVFLARCAVNRLILTAPMVATGGLQDSEHVTAHKEPLREQFLSTSVAAQ